MNYWGAKGYVGPTPLSNYWGASLSLSSYAYGINEWTGDCVNCKFASFSIVFVISGPIEGKHERSFHQ